eukprot:snap_masked-scaffold_27-processed-gene-4.46-mRNA-1 protein AED:0.11 eAED:0.11 QI:0/0/0/1/1/1/2/0/381
MNRRNSRAVSIEQIQTKATKPYSFIESYLPPALLFCLLWSSCSISMVLLNKIILTSFDFKFNTFLLIYQNSLCVLLLKLFKFFGWIEFESLEADKVKAWLPLDFFFVLMLLTGTFSIKYLSVPMITVFKNANNIVITFTDFLIYRNSISNGVLYSLALMLLAAVLASLQDMEFSLKGYIWTMVNCLCTALFVLYMPKAISKTKLSSFGKVYYNNVLSVPLLLLVDFFFFGDCAQLFDLSFNLGPEEISFTQFAANEHSIQTQVDDSAVHWSLSLHLALFCSGIIGFALSGSLNKIPLTFLGVFIFKTELTTSGAVYVAISLLAGGVFGYTKAKAKEEKQNATSKNSFLDEIPEEKRSKNKAYNGVRNRAETAPHIQNPQAV